MVTMSDDYYRILEIPRSASADEIHKAYRGMARKYHPDLNPDDDDAKKRFQEVQRAYEVLSDPEKRDLYDRYGSSFESMGMGGDGPRPGGGPRGYSTSGGNFSFEDVDLSELFGGGRGAGPGGFADLFKQFSGGRGRTTARRPARGQDIRQEIEVPFRTAIMGGEVQLSMRRATGEVETLTVKIPAGIEDGRKIRLRGQGERAAPGGKPGDILITVRVSAHPWFRRRGAHLEVRVPISLSEAIAGAKVDVPTPKGTITLTIPPNTSSGKKLRIKGHGVPQKSGAAGDLYAEVQIVLPEKIDEQVAQAIKEAKVGPHDARAGLKW